MEKDTNGYVCFLSFVIGITELCYMGVNIVSTVKFYVNVDKRDKGHKYNHIVQPINII